MPDSKKDRPNSQQERAIESDAQEILLSAGAGSGKTFVLQSRISRLVDPTREGKAELSELLPWRSPALRSSSTSWTPPTSPPSTPSRSTSSSATGLFSDSRPTFPSGTGRSFPGRRTNSSRRCSTSDTRGSSGCSRRVALFPRKIRSSTPT